MINGSPAKAEKPREVVPCNAAGSIFYLPEAPLLAVLLLRLTRGILTSVLHPVRREAVASGRSMIDTCKATAELCACLVCGLTVLAIVPEKGALKCNHHHHHHHHHDEMTDGDTSA